MLLIKMFFIFEKVAVLLNFQYIISPIRKHEFLDYTYRDLQCVDLLDGGIPRGFSKPPWRNWN